MSRVGFETTIRVFEREKTVQALDRAATVIDFVFTSVVKFLYMVAFMRLCIPSYGLFFLLCCVLCYFLLFHLNRKRLLFFMQSVPFSVTQPQCSTWGYSSILSGFQRK
jgi:hypothetical protein